MESRVELFGHPVHQMLVVLPLGLLAGAVIFDIVYLVSDNVTFSAVAYWVMVAGVIAALVAAPFGLIDYLKIPAGTRAKRVGAMHGGGNVIVVGLFLASVILRGGDAQPPESNAAYVCSFLGVLLALVTGWLGGELVNQLGIGVHDGANVDAPSSLRTARARVRAS